jgi:hypothetical protein
MEPRFKHFNDAELEVLETALAGMSGETATTLKAELRGYREGKRVLPRGGSTGSADPPGDSFRPPEKA